LRGDDDGRQLHSDNARCAGRSVDRIQNRSITHEVRRKHAGEPRRGAGTVTNGRAAHA